MPNIGPLLRTVAHLEPGQVWHRLRLTARRRLWERRREQIDARYRERAAALPRARFDHEGLARVAAYRTETRVEDLVQTARDVLDGHFTFLNRSIDFGRDVDWYRPELDVGTRLWKTHLHEFSYAPALALAHRLDPQGGFRERLFQLFESWSEASPIGRREFALDSWNARAVATRLVHFAVAGSLLGLDAARDPDSAELGREIGRHGLFLRDNLELDLRGNHLLRDAVGLVFAEATVGGVPDALTLLEAQVSEQMLPDGCHVERAPMYHAICLEDLLEVQLLLGGDAPAWLADAVARMAGFLDAILLGDGDLPLLGDGWRGEIDCAHLLGACRRVAGGLPAPEDPDRHSGIVALHRGDHRAVVRAGRHGPDYLLGHAHGDLLSFDLSIGAQRCVTDTGTARYDPGPERQYLRSTAAHNTLQIDAEEQIEAWGSFRVGRRGIARVRARGEDAGWDWVWAEADSFAHLRGRPVHQRLVAVSTTGVLVLDAVLGSGSHACASRLHLHPDRPDTGVHVLALGAEPTRERAPLHERFGETREMTCLTVARAGPLPWTGGWWIGSGAGPRTPESAALACVLELDDAVVSLSRAASPVPAVTWRLEHPGEPDCVVFCSPERESAT